MKKIPICQSLVSCEYPLFWLYTYTLEAAKCGTDTVENIATLPDTRQSVHQSISSPPPTLPQKIESMTRTASAG
jgi:hypothetical protein